MTRPIPTSSPTIIDSADAPDYLERMGISLQALQQALGEGETAAGNTDDNHPVTAAGYYRWAETNASIRRSHTRDGQWTRRNPSGRPLIENNEADYALIACGGDAATGTKEMSNVARKKGPAMEAAHRGQTTQMELRLFVELKEKSDQNAAMPSADQPPTGEWILLYHRDKEELRAEVSLPAGFSDGFVTDWVVRVILPTTDMKKRTQVPKDIGGGDVEFNIEEAQ